MNTRVVLAARPDGAPTADDFRIETSPVPEPGDGELLLRTIYLSLDPYIRGRMGPGLVYRSLAAPMELGTVIPGGTVCEVVESRYPGISPGAVVLAGTGWQAYGVQPGAAVRLLDPDAAPVSTALGVLGVPGFTGYVGLNLIARPRPGETVVVAAASGAVGSMVAQLARMGGARAVGIAGGPEKTSWLREIGLDAVIDHREPGFDDALAAATPDGIDVYFENVGGHVLEAVIPRLNAGTRVPVCGLVSMYNGAPAEPRADLLPAFMSAILSRQITVQGFAYVPYVEAHQDEFLRQATEWVRSGAITYREQIVDGLESAPDAFIGILGGANFGKLLIKP
ncbi:NADP-dependent oxidoreductase [Parafrankia sp. FMc2]|uniref:NADP-dependent oxidoreductase n=1 Tax=Parafrankia sp. FMc2 TaxID=3233196 RepID=UPI0034D75B28